jgi:hypothetical protein
MSLDIIPDDHVKDVCRFGAGEATCSYLLLGTAWRCAKGTDAGLVITARREAGTMSARGDNCPGWGRG